MFAFRGEFIRGFLARISFLGLFSCKTSTNKSTSKSTILKATSWPKSTQWKLSRTAQVVVPTLGLLPSGHSCCKTCRWSLSRRHMPFQHCTEDWRLAILMDESSPSISQSHSLWIQEPLPTLAAQRSHRKIAVTAVAASGLAAIPSPAAKKNRNR